MKKARVVIGANWGDEGKGLMTDYFASEGDALVVRFNGGANAGHTVVTPDGKRHVFGHFGSGTFAKAPTYLSRFFIVNPILFHKEWLELYNKVGHPGVYADEEARVTTLYDMMVNQVIENARGDKRHGSCGVGLHETVVRHNVCPLTVMDLYDEKYVRNCLDLISRSYVPQRLKQLGVIEVSPKFEEVLNDKGVVEKFLEDVKFFKHHVLTAGQNITEKAFENVIFEGAQGLQLDADNNEFFPHVTCSKTGLHNVELLATKFGIDVLDIVYVTRCYTTRHGVGPFPDELNDLPYSKVKDDTNVTNDYQGGLRFGRLNVNRLAKTVTNDILQGQELFHNIAVTCLDQIDDDVVLFIDNDKLCKRQSDSFVEYLVELTAARKGYLSFGPTRMTIRSTVS